MQGARDLPAGPLPARLSERRTPGRRTSALSKVETDSALERLRTKDVRRATSPFDAPVPVNAAGGAYGNWARPGSPETGVAGTIGRRSPIGTLGPSRRYDRTMVPVWTFVAVTPSRISGHIR